jgi:hypothetical protein
VWYPIILSRRKSFHHRKVQRVRRETGNKTSPKESFIFRYNTVLDIVENKSKETSNGQKED